MGTLYYAVNNEKKQYYELGKGIWFELSNRYPDGSYMTPGDMDCSEYGKVFNKVHKIFEGYEWNSDKDKLKEMQISADLMSIGPNVKICDDSTMGFLTEEWHKIGSRYDPCL